MKIYSVAELAKIDLQENEKIKEGLIRSNWEKIFGDLASYAKVNYLKDNTLKIIVKNSNMSNYIYMNKNKILKKIFDLTNLKIENIEIKIN